MKFSVPGSQFSVNPVFLRTENWEPRTGYQGVDPLTFRVHTIYLGA